MSASYRTSSAFGNNTGAALVGSFATVAGDLLCVWAAQKGNTTGGTVTDDAGGTWTNPVNQGTGSGATALSGGWFVRNQFATGATINVTFTPGGVSPSAAEMVVVAVSGMRGTASSGFGAGHALRSGGGAAGNGAGGTTPSFNWTTPSPTKSTSMLLVAVTNGANPPGLTVPTGFTSRQNVGQTSPIGAEVATVDSGRADTAESWSSSTTNWITQGIELDPLVSDGNDMSSGIGYSGAGGNALARPAVQARTRGYQGLPLTASLGFLNAVTTRSHMSIIEAKQNTAIKVPVFMRDVITGKGTPNATLTVAAAKNGASSFSTITPTITDAGGGDYWLALTASHTDTLGPMRIRVSGSGLSENDELVVNVIAIDKADAVRMGLSSLPNAAAGANTGLPVQGGAIPNAAANAVGGLATITAAGQGPGGTLKPNTVIDNYVYDANKNPTSWRVRVFATAAAADTAYAAINATTGQGNADGADSEIEREKYTAEYNATTKLLLGFKRHKEL